MFTGLVQAVGQIKDVSVGEGGGTITVLSRKDIQWGGIGASVAVDGVCLTLRQCAGRELQFDVLGETFQRTNLGKKGVGSSVNLEPALKLGDSLGGHWVTGHVDGIGSVAGINRVGRDRSVVIACSPHLTAMMVIKGSVCCDGISLTLVEVRHDSFTVHVIPHTWANTSWQSLAVGMPINIETDIIGKYVLKLTQIREGPTAQGGITWQSLKKAGYVIES